ncbi:hypothetical protein [Sphingomonas elodea]|uniref:hypothetical protein n=1 Tax=Sphingomonas elodea TaxID=179878 RepID=UPI00026312E0|nr:hypothetical protein [Sphingomonas elodea]
MTPASSDPDLPPPAPSLAGRLFAQVRAQGGARARDAAPRHAGWIAPVLALLVASGPAATILGAHVLRVRAMTETAAMDARLAPRREAERARDAARAVLGAALAQPGPAALLDRVAAALPQADTLTRAERRADGTIELEVATSDPDALRGAMRRHPMLAGLRDVRQREGEGRTLVLLRQAAP